MGLAFIVTHYLTISPENTLKCDWVSCQTKMCYTSRILRSTLQLNCGFEMVHTGGGGNVWLV
jgi:hypothetical protein